MKVELIYDADCPNVAAARSMLTAAFAKARIAARWLEWERDNPESPAYARRFGSPTILVDGRDVAGAVPGGEDASCRVYRSAKGRLAGTPSQDQLLSALHAAGKAQGGALRVFATPLPAIGAALLPKLTCPLCWPAYTAILGALGVGFVDYTPYLLPATLAFLAIAVGALALAAHRTRRWLPLLLGVASAGMVLVGKFAIDAEWVTNGGIALLVVATFLSTRVRTAMPPTCEACGEANSRTHVRDAS